MKKRNAEHYVTENYAGKGYDRYIFTATGEIDNKNALVAVVVNGYPTGENKFCLHEVKIIEADSLSMTETAKNSTSVREFASDNSIPDTAQKSQEVFEKKISFAAEDDTTASRR